MEANAEADLLVVDPNHFQVQLGQRAVRVTRLEFDLLFYLIANSDRTSSVTTS